MTAVVFAAGHAENGDTDHEGESRTEADFADDFVIRFHGFVFIDGGLSVAAVAGSAWRSCAGDLF